MSSSTRKGPGQLSKVQAGEPQNSSPGILHSIEYQAYSGPLPPPETLRHFEEVLPGSAQIIVSEFTSQAAHRRAMERQVITSNAFSQRLGSIAGCVIGLLGVGGGLWLTHEGKSTGGLTAVIATLTGLVAVYLGQRKKQSAERLQKRAGAD